MRTTKAGRIVVASQELQESHMWRKKIMGYLLALGKCRFVSWCKFRFNIKRIRVTTAISKYEAAKG